MGTVGAVYLEKGWMPVSGAALWYGCLLRYGPDMASARA